MRLERPSVNVARTGVEDLLAAVVVFGHRLESSIEPNAETRLLEGWGCFEEVEETKK